MDLSVIIVNWNTKKLLKDCLNSIYQFTSSSRHSEPFTPVILSGTKNLKNVQGKLREESRSFAVAQNDGGEKGITFEVIVVDNGSEDGSVGLVRKKFPKVKLISNSENLGFTKANNQGIKIARGKYILLLNSDTYLIENSLAKLVKKAEGLENLGALGPQLLNEDKTIQQSAGFFPNLPQIFWWMTFIDDLPGGQILKPYHIDHDAFYKNDEEVDWVTAAAILIPRTVVNKVGVLDEKIFMYGEEVEWCYRAKKAGYSTHFSQDTKIVHIGRGSSGKISQNAIIGEYKGIIYFYKKHKNAKLLQIVRILLKIGALARVAAFLAIGRRELAKTYVQAFKVV